MFHLLIVTCLRLFPEAFLSTLLTHQKHETTKQTPTAPAAETSASAGEANKPRRSDSSLVLEKLGSFLAHLVSGK